MISVIIPTLNEAVILPELFNHIKKNIGKGIVYEILICDAGSKDESVQISTEFAATVIHSPEKNKAFQMNLGAQKAKGEILYFLHADTFPPSSFGQAIKNYCQNGFNSGCFQLTFDYNHWLLRLSSWATRFNIKYFQFGDQSLFITRELFDQLNGYNSNLSIMEDVDLITRIKKVGKFKIIPKAVISSSRRYLKNGIIKTECINGLILLLYLLGSSQKTLLNIYSVINRKKNQ